MSIRSVRGLIIVLGAILSLGHPAPAYSPSASPSEGKSEFENIQNSDSLSIVVVDAIQESKNGFGGSESTYELSVVRNIRGTPRTRIRLFGGRSEVISGYPRLDLGVDYLLAIVPWGARDELTGDRVSLIPISTVRTSSALAELANVSLNAKATPIWPRTFVRTFPARLHAWQNLIFDPTFASEEQRTLGNLHGILNEWNTFRSSDSNPLEVVQISDPIQYGNGRSEYWGERTLAEIQQYFGYDASGACGIAFTRFNPLETDVVIVQGCLTPRVVLHELGHFLSLDHPFEHINVTFPSVMDYSCATRVSAADINTLNHYYPGRFSSLPDLVVHPRAFRDNSAGNSASCGAPTIAVSNNGQFTTHGGVTVDNSSAEPISLSGFRFELIPRNYETDFGPQRPSYPELDAPLAPISVPNPILIQPYSSHSLDSSSIIGDIRFGSDAQRVFGSYTIGVRPYGIAPVPTRPFSEISDFFRRADVELGDPQPLMASAVWVPLPFEVLTWQAGTYLGSSITHAAFSIFLRPGDRLELDLCRAGAVFETATGFGVPTIDYNEVPFGGTPLASFGITPWATPESLGDPCFPGRASWPSGFQANESSTIYVTLGVNFEALNPFQTFPAGMSRIKPMYRVVGASQGDTILLTSFE